MSFFLFWVVSKQADTQVRTLLIRLHSCVQRPSLCMGCNTILLLSMHTRQCMTRCFCGSCNSQCYMLSRLIYCHIVRKQRGLTLHCCIKFFLLLILVAKGLYVQKLLDDMLSPLSNLRNSRWRPRWPPLHINDHNSLPVHLRKVIFVSIPRF